MNLMTVEAVSVGSRNTWAEAKHGDRVAAAVRSTAVVAVDETHLSGSGELLAVEVGGSEVRWERVVQLRERIAAGTYRVSSLEIASRMIDQMMR